METIIEEFKEQLDNKISAFKKEMSGIRANRPSAILLENLIVSYYDQKMPMKHIASISVSPPRDIFVQAWDKESVPAIVKAIEMSSLGLNPQAEGLSVRVSLPELSQERRDELVRHVKKIAEQFRINIRSFRDETNKKIQKALDNNELSEDKKFELKENVQKYTDNTNKEIENILNSKIKEINE